MINIAGDLVIFMTVNRAIVVIRAPKNYFAIEKESEFENLSKE